jgi:hypothetical protein
MSSTLAIRNTMSLSTALAHAVVFLTRPLAGTYPTTIIIALQRALEDALTPYYAATWCPAAPSRGAGRRCLTLAPGAAPPRPIHAACAQAGVAWTCWAAVLGGRELDLFVDPGCVRVRVAGTTHVVWAAAPPATSAGPHADDSARVHARAAARAAIHQAARARLLRTLAVRTASLSAGADASDSEDSDGGSVSSRASSFFSTRSSTSSASSAGSPKCKSVALAAFNAEKDPKIERKGGAPAPARHALSRRDRALQRRAGVVVAPPAVPAEYDGGRTTVLGGGVRLGAVRA